ncbi:MAG: PEGA domain-containing protein [Bdellovibrionota bacterium]
MNSHIRIRNTVTYLLLLCFLFTATGCATIVNGTKQKVKISSNPDGATIEIDGLDNGTTPATLKLKRKEETYEIIVKKAGYKAKKIRVENDMSAWVWGNFILGGIIGLVIDMVSGGGFKLEPNQINVTLEPEQGQASPAPPATVPVN